MVVGVVEDNFGIIGLLLWYWILGMFLFSIFVVGHDCGHGTFSSYTWVNDLFGHVAHAPTMDMSHPWIPEKLYLSLNWISKHYLKFPLTGFISWIPLYTIFGIPDGSHFWPWSKLFENNTDRIKCVVSVAACFWLVLITYLQHHDEETEVYEEGTWGFVKGQLQTVDRSFGFGIDKALHNITDGHVAHHLFFTRIPHYNLPKATEAVKRILMEKYPGTYKYKKSYDFLIEFLW
uniref:Fatty acid desaturase domain-containing protein n=1 Tax=Meloidogyne javanica TaxID=6303 RepID=A0A915LEG6_MELJA